jgi:hypothetical protein
METNMKLNWIAWILMTLAAAGSAWGFGEDERQAIRTAVDAAVDDMSGISKSEGILVLPIRGDRSQLAEGALKAALSRAGYNVVEPADQEVWAKILEEIEWAERKEDILDAGTLVKFGAIQGARQVAYGALVQVDSTPERVYAELALHAASLATRQHVWGGQYAERRYLAADVKGAVPIDPNVSTVLAALGRQIEVSVAAAADRPAGAVAIVPLAGDTDGYVTAMVRDALSRAGVNLRDLDVRTSAQAQRLLRDDPAKADAILAGGVRDLSVVRRQPDPSTSVEEIRVVVQVAIRNAQTGQIVWSGTFGEVQRFSEKQTLWELARGVDPKIWLYGGGGLLVLMFLAAFLKATQRVR